MMSNVTLFWEVDLADQSDRSESDSEPLRSVYRRPCRARAGIAHMQLGHEFIVGFDLEHCRRKDPGDEDLGDVAELQVGPECDMLQVAAMFGFEVTEQVTAGAQTVAIPREPSPVRRQAARVALLERFLEVPVLRHRREKWTIELVRLASSLAESGFDTEDSLRYHLKRLAQHWSLDFNTGRRAALDDGDLAQAISIGAEFLDPFEKEWIWFSDVDKALRDLSDPRSDVMKQLEDTPTWDSTADPHSSSESEPDRRKEVALSGFRGDARDRDDARKKESWRFPLYWKLVDEELAPEDGEFRSAIELSTTRGRTPMARVTVECPSGSHRPALYARIIGSKGAMAAGALLSDPRGWSGSIAIPKRFNSDIHHVEVMSTPTAPRLDDHKRAECEQWALLALAQEDASQDSAYSWLQADLLSDA